MAAVRQWIGFVRRLPQQVVCSDLGVTQGESWDRDTADPPDFVELPRQHAMPAVMQTGRDYLLRLSAGNAFKSWRIMGREGCRRATVLNPSRRNAEAVPVNMLDVQPGRVTSTGYASTASALARLAVFKASAMRADMMPCLR